MCMKMPLDKTVCAGSGGGFFKACPEPLVKAVFFFLVQEKPVLVRITSEGPSKENRLEEII